MNKKDLPNVTLKTAFMAMCYVAREEGIELNEKYEQLMNDLITYNDLNVTDMVDNMENIYQLLTKELE